MKNVEKWLYYRKAGVYRIYSLIDDRCYIGSTKNLYRRIATHRSKLINGTHTNSKLQTFVRQYGIEALAVEVLCKCKKEELCKMEDLNREKFDSFNTGFDLAKKSHRVLSKKEKQRIQRKLEKDILYGRV